jgi:hypothetical protein
VAPRAPRVKPVGSHISVTGPGLTRYLDIAGNIFVLIDEFDGDHQNLGMFGTETKSASTKYAYHFSTSSDIVYSVFDISIEENFSICVFIYFRSIV